MAGAAGEGQPRPERPRRVRGWLRRPRPARLPRARARPARAPEPAAPPPEPGRAPSRTVGAVSTGRAAARPEPERPPPAWEPGPEPPEPEPEPRVSPVRVPRGPRASPAPRAPPGPGPELPALGPPASPQATGAAGAAGATVGAGATGAAGAGAAGVTGRQASPRGSRRGRRRGCQRNLRSPAPCRSPSARDRPGTAPPRRRCTDPRRCALAGLHDPGDRSREVGTADGSGRCGRALAGDRATRQVAGGVLRLAVDPRLEVQVWPVQLPVQPT